MPEPVTFDVAAAHRHFAAQCFNLAWEFIDQSPRSSADDHAMLLAAQASLWHWTQRPDCTDQNLSIGTWQIARIFSLLGRAENALEYANRCLAHSQNLPPFFLGYAHEAISRAALLSGQKELAAEHLGFARSALAAIENADERSTLAADLASLSSQLAD